MPFKDRVFPGEFSGVLNGKLSFQSTSIDRVTITKIEDHYYVFRNYIFDKNLKDSVDGQVYS